MVNPCFQNLDEPINLMKYIYSNKSWSSNCSSSCYEIYFKVNDLVALFDDIGSVEDEKGEESMACLSEALGSIVFHLFWFFGTYISL